MKLVKIVAVGAVALFASLAIAEKAPESVERLAPTLKAWGENPILVAAVKAQNAKGASLDQIKQRDATWRATSGIDDFMKSLLENEAAKELLKLESSKPYLFELFLMDDQGANVAMTNKTSDYWQGDEAKFTESFKGGSGAVHIGDVEFDESAQAYLVQISVPVTEGGSAVGAMTIGVNIDQLEAQ
ncbi:MAG: PDC sensor domain-containing protein [Gammaproteobacteria bacterium]|nr:PDC sensor domain-containing protein [Gammaproteobacteria bacterium]